MTVDAWNRSARATMGRTRRSRIIRWLNANISSGAVLSVFIAACCVTADARSNTIHRRCSRKAVKKYTPASLHPQ
jgi:hypothetical protein